MTITHEAGRIVSDRSPVIAVSVGIGGWILPDLRGRTLSWEQALGLMLAADALDGCSYPSMHPIWGEVASWIASAGLSPREAVLLLGLSVEGWQLPEVVVVPRERRVLDCPRHWSMRGLLGLAARWKAPR